MSFNKYNMRQDGDVIITAGRVDMYDVATVCRFYGNKDTDTWGTEYYRDADLNGDGFIDITDLATVGYYYGESDDKWIVTRDPLIWWRNAGAKREKSWNGRLIWWSFTGEEPNEFQWWDAQGNTGTEPQWVADGAFQTLPTKGFYGRIKIYSDWYVTWPLGTDAERLKISVAFGRYDLGWGEPNVWKEADLSWNVQQAFGALILEAKALGYVTAIHPILELGNAEGELWIDYFQYHAPKK